MPYERTLAIAIQIAAFGSAFAAAQLPAADAGLPHLALDRLPAGVRTQIQDVYDQARAHPDDPRRVGRLAMLLHAYEQYQSADACYRIARRLEPSSAAWPYLGGIVEAELGHRPAAIASFRAALRQDAANPPARVRLADALLDNREAAASRTEFEALVRDFPELAVAHYGLGRLAAGAGDLKAAAEHYGRAVSASPQFGAAHYALALAYRNLGLDDRAEPHLDAYRRLGPSRPVLSDRLMLEVMSLRSSATGLITEGARLGTAGQLDRAIALLVKALEADPQAAQAHVNLISLYGRVGRPDDAIAHYRAALAADPNLADAHYNYGVLLASQGRDADAAEAFSRALAADPFHAQAHNNLASLMARQGRLAEAAEHYREALVNDPQHRSARFNLGRVLIELRQPAEAIEQLRRTLTPEDADTPRYMYALATAYVRAGDMARAREYALQALQRARRLGQTALAAAIEKDLDTIRKAPQR